MEQELLESNKLPGLLLISLVREQGLGDDKEAKIGMVSFFGQVIAVCSAESAINASLEFPFRSRIV